MGASRRVLESARSPYTTAMLDAAVERQARRDAGASSSPAASLPPNMTLGEPSREAHLESMTVRTSPSTVRVEALQMLGNHLTRDENFGHKMRTDPRRALAGLDFLTEREQHILGSIDGGVWSKLADASDKFHVGKVSKKGLAGVPEGIAGPSSSGYDPMGGGAPLGWDQIGPPGRSGITLGNGVKTPPRGGGGGGGYGSSDEGGGGGFGIPDYGVDHGNAGDPTTPMGRPIGGGRGLGRGNPFEGGDLDRYGTVGVHGDPYEGGGISGGRLPSRAVLAGAAWHALHPGGNVTDGDGGPKKPPPPPPDSGTGGAPPPQPTATPGAPAPTNPPAPTGIPMTGEYKYVDQSKAPTLQVAPDSLLRDVVLGASVGGVYGGAVALAASSPALLVPLVLGGIYQGGLVGAAYHTIFHRHQPADTDLTGGGSPGGPRAAGAAVARYGREAVPYLTPNLEGTGGTGPSGPRSSGLASRASREGREATPNLEGTGGSGPVGPRARSSGRTFGGDLYKPAPDDPSPGGPR